MALSRAMHPKQFLALHGEETMLQATMKRISDLDINSSLTICNEEHRFFVAEQLRELGKLDSIILEPDGRNTAPAIALAAMMSEIENDPILLVLAADHIIEDKTSFTEKVKEAIPLAESGNLVTFGIVPHEPNTGYGYIKCGDSIGAGFEVENSLKNLLLLLLRILLIQINTFGIVACFYLRQVVIWRSLRSIDLISTKLVNYQLKISKGITIL